MADFTKDELEDLLICTYGGIYDDHPPEPWKEDLTEKIKHMIESYCEHEYQEDRHHMDIYLCAKCGKREWWENLGVHNDNQ